ncbi:MAG: polysaccharide deacetylase family protein [Anaerolineae bacterium]|nr:polysaccharide deacetylase family protein [Anaerolineae bacterium]MDW8298702.1 polysaccharide deacetylase family protein [Anaerolineae bacterium]
MAKRSQLAIAMLARLGVPRLLDTFWGKNRLTVLAYHRITDATAPDFLYYRPNVSASPQMFARQMAWIAKRFNVISLPVLHAFLTKGRPLPSRPLLITFDDGYLDNYQNAFPVLKRLQLPAVIFLMTSRMEHPAPPWWDECALYLNLTEHQQAELPLIGMCDLSTPEARRAVTDRLLRALKQVPEAEKQAAIRAVRERLDVPEPTADPPLFVNWEQVREMVAADIACMPHTVNHPILTRVDAEQAYYELAESRAQIEAQTDQQATAFAYPNGTPSDYNAAIIQMLRDLGFQSAYTLTPAPMSLRALRRYPLQIRRAFLLYKDSFDLFKLKVMGLPSLVARPRYYKEN